MCRLRIFREPSEHFESYDEYTCDEMRLIQEDLKKDFRKANFTDSWIKSGRRDRRYEEFCASIDEFLAQCKCQPMQTDNKGQA